MLKTEEIEASPRSITHGSELKITSQHMSAPRESKHNVFRRLTCEKPSLVRDQGVCEGHESPREHLNRDPYEPCKAEEPKDSVGGAGDGEE